MSPSDYAQPIDQTMAAWICELCAHFTVLAVERTTSPSSCAQSNLGHCLIRYFETEQATAIRHELTARGTTSEWPSVRIPASACHLARTLVTMMETFPGTILDGGVSCLTDERRVVETWLIPSGNGR